MLQICLTMHFNHTVTEAGGSTNPVQNNVVLFDFPAVALMLASEIGK